MTQKSLKKFFYFVIFIFLSAINILSVSPAFARETDSKTVCVGYYRGDPEFQWGFSDDERKSGYAYEYYQEIATLTGWNYKYVYGTREEVLGKLVSGEVDIVAGVTQTDELKGQVLFSEYDMGLEGEKRYFAVNSRRPELLEQLNRAQKELSSFFPDFLTTIQQNYYKEDSQKQSLTAEERNWLSEKGTLKVGYIQGNLPLSDQLEDGSPTGVFKDLLSSLSAYLDIPLEPVCYENVIHMEEGLRRGEVDAAFPLYSDFWITEQKGFFQTDSFISDRVMIIYRGDYRDNLMDKIAISETGVGQRYYVSIYYPNAEMVYYNTKRDSFEAIQNNEVNCMIGCASILQNFFARHSEYQNFNIAYLDTSEYFSMAVNRGENLLVGILNKAIRQMDKTSITSAMIQYSSVERTYTFTDFIRHYAVLIIGVLSIFFAILLGMFISFRHKTQAFNMEQARTRAALEDALGVAKSASEAKTIFLSNMSHDIRTPMNGIIGMTAIAEAHMDDPSRVRDCLSKITSSGKHLLALINEVLDMSKIESGEVCLNEEVFDLSVLMDDLITLNKQQADARNHYLVVHILGIVHERVVGDNLRIQQVFTNLVGNAIKYTPNGGRIEITLSEKPSGNPKLGCFEFVVKDNGIGMSEEYLPHIFEAFTRAESASVSRTQGTGLGMAIARNIIRMMDGDIVVKSILGQGSEFTVTLFLKLEEAENAEDTENTSCEEFSDLKILVVDEDQIAGEATCALLTRMGITGEWTAAGEEVLERIETNYKNNTGYYGVMIDWEMQGMGGAAMVSEIQKKFGDEGPVVIVSTYDQASIEAEALKAGARAFVEKPMFKSRLVHLFNKLLDHVTEEEATGLKELTQQVDFSGKRALMAEDNEINAEIAIEILGMTSLSVDWARDGREAVHMMERSEPGYYDCIFMDVQMPVMSGLEAARAIRELSHPDAESIPIFAMTANAFAEDVQAVLKAGMNEHISKPLNFEVLLKILNKYLNR